MLAIKLKENLKIKVFKWGAPKTLLKKPKKTSSLLAKVCD
jgi:hypothetical protein